MDFSLRIILACPAYLLISSLFDMYVQRSKARNSTGYAPVDIIHQTSW
jgi:hypothetical protein